MSPEVRCVDYCNSLKIEVRKTGRRFCKNVTITLSGSFGLPDFLTFGLKKVAMDYELH